MRSLDTLHVALALELGATEFCSFDMEHHLAIEKLAADNYAYFAKFRELARSLDLEWDHLDLLSVRETNQA